MLRSPFGLVPRCGIGAGCRCIPCTVKKKEKKRTLPRFEAGCVPMRASYKSNVGSPKVLAQVLNFINFQALRAAGSLSVVAPSTSVCITPWCSRGALHPGGRAGDPGGGGEGGGERLREGVIHRARNVFVYSISPEILLRGYVGPSGMCNQPQSFNPHV